MNVLLISTYELGRQPFGIASAASWLERAGARVTCVDTSVEEAPRDEDIKAARIVAFYVPMHTATRKAIPLAQRISKVNPAAHLCFFGLYASMNAPMLQSLGVRTIISGEFEPGLVDLYRRVEAGEVSSDITKVSLDKQTFLIPQRRGLPALENYARVKMPDGSELNVGYTEASRGCKHTCRHCPVVPVYNGRFRIVDSDVVLADIEQQVAAGARHITFGDPDFWNGPKHAHELVRELHRRFPDVTYDVTIKVEHLLAHADEIKTLRDTGCLFVTSAIESVDDRVLEIFDKRHTRADFIRVVELFRDARLVLTPTFVTFTPWTTLDGYIDLLHLLDELDLVEHVPPIQLAIRLLIPAGSKLLELAEVQRIVGRFDPAALCYPWTHEDPRVDALQCELLQSVNNDVSRHDFFDLALRRAHELAARTPPQAYHRPVKGFVPYLTEPWYC